MRTADFVPRTPTGQNDWAGLFREADSLLGDTASWALIAEGEKNRSTASMLRARYPRFEITIRRNDELGGFDYWVRKKGQA